jgi:formate dehydrogenase major subunit
LPSGESNSHGGFELLLACDGSTKAVRRRAKMKNKNEDARTAKGNAGRVDDAGAQPTRRQFLKGLTTGTVAIGALTQSGCAPAVPQLKTRGASETTTVCPFCGVGCGQVVSTRGGKVINIEGDPGHPISEGTLCSKGAAGIQVVNNPRRLQKVLYRKPQGAAWEEKSWDWALERIAERVKETRDKNFMATVDGRVVNRTEAMACLGGSALDNEEAYLLVKLMRALGLVYIEHQARL